MNKTKIILVSIGGVVLLGTLGLAFLIWSAWQEKSENAESLEFAVNDVNNLAAGVSVGEGDAAVKVYPGEDAVKALEANRDLYLSWIEASRVAASTGDRKFEATTPPAFKAKMVEDAKRLAELPGAVDGKLVKESFGFGFNGLIHGGELPKAEDLSRLQREWNDVSLVVDLLAQAGIDAVDEIEVVQAQPAEGQEEEEARPAKKNRKKRARDAEEEVPPAVTAFTIAFRTQADGLVGALNALTANSRFIVTEDLRFSRELDALVAKLGGGAGKPHEEAASGRGRRGRRGAAIQEPSLEEAGEEQKGGVICNPQDAPLLKVTMKVSVYDFHTAEKSLAEAAAETTKTEETED